MNPKNNSAGDNPYLFDCPWCGALKNFDAMKDLRDDARSNGIRVESHTHKYEQTPIPI